MAATQPSVHQLYRRLETIGKGAYGSVHKGEHIPTGNVVALKIINLDDKSGSDDVGDIQREVALLTQLRDAPNVTKYYGCYMDGPRVWIVMELAQGGSVLSLMKASRNGCIEEKYVSVIVREVLVGLSYLHKVPVIHRDIKAANILVTAAGKVVICDFGVSALLATSSSKRNTLTGTPHWMAPELLQTLPVYDTKADIWSLGILIYEMIKGSPPHNTLENIKVMDLIPKAKPPRLQENEAGKDLRDFMAMCLKESPAERLPADELSKSKWIKSVAKVSISVLKDLVLRFEQAAKRASLAEPLDWEEEEERDLLHLDVADENPWEFETVRGRSFRLMPFDEDAPPNPESENEPTHSTIRPPQSTHLPSSLRLLFEDDSTPQQETLRPPAFQIPSHPSAPSPSSSIAPSTSPSPGRERIPIRRAQTLDTLGDDLSAKQKTFVYPPRGMTRSRSKLSPSVPDSDDEGSSHTHFDPNSTPSPRIRPSPSPDPSSPDFYGDPAKKPSLRDPRTLRSNRPPFEIDTTPSASDEEQANDETSPATTVTPGFPSSTPESFPPNSPWITRKRSKSTGEALDPRRVGRVDLDLESSSAFQFPPSPKPFLSSEPTPSTSLPPRSHSRMSPTHLSASTSVSSPGAHQTTYSLDTSASARRVPTPNPMLPPSITRTRSATTLPETPPPNTEASLLRKGSANDGAPLIPPLKPFALTGRSRSGSDASQSIIPGTPGLKDVLKARMSDLLPPSPSAAVYNARNFLASPSSLNFSVTSSNADTHRQYSAFRDAASSAATSFSLGLPPSQSPPPLRRIATEPPFSASLSERGGAHARKISLGTATASTPSLGPPVRPLNYSKLITDENTYSELARTIDDLTQWLTVVEVGLSGMLDKVYTDTIEEEQEVPSDAEDEQITPGHPSLSRKTTMPADV
ncbi:hypothetical protein D9615_002457 [Tricholomella constricta]|uniref:non-specific serine/threonine protein kinase n=1 Tax=Tricholomella constricta TaxID=117010 RepID=A0A8H5M933_9AGAR|nr:hypothetical protein D9615_002457 [Tricholomella constricta]